MEDFLRVIQALNDKSRLEILMFLKAQEYMFCVICNIKDLSPLCAILLQELEHL